MSASGYDSSIRDIVIRGSRLGLVTDVHPFNVPPDGLVEAENVDVFWPREIRRRYGVQGRWGMGSIGNNVRAMKYVERHDGSKALVVVDENGLAYDDGMNGVFTTGVATRNSELIPISQVRDLLIVGGVSDFAAIGFDGSMNTLRPYAPEKPMSLTLSYASGEGSVGKKYVYYRFTIEFGEGTAFAGETPPIKQTLPIMSGGSLSGFREKYWTETIDLTAAATDDNAVTATVPKADLGVLQDLYNNGARVLNVYKYETDIALDTGEVENAPIPFTLIASVKISDLVNSTSDPATVFIDDGNQPAGRTTDYDAFMGSFSWSYAAVMKGRLWVANVKRVEREGPFKFLSWKDYPHRLYFSRLASIRPEPFTFRESGFLEISPQDGGGITGLAVAGKGVLVATTKSSLTFIFVGDRSLDNYLPDIVQRDIPGVGCPAPKSMVSTPIGAVFLSHDGVYAASSKGITNLAEGRIRNSFMDMTERQRESAVSVYDRRNRRIMVFVSEGSAGQNNTAYVYDIAQKKWTRFVFPYGVGAAAEIEESDGRTSVALGVLDTNLDASTKHPVMTLSNRIWSDDGSDVTMSFKTGHLDLGAPTVEKEFLEVGAIVDGDDDLTFDVEIEGWGDTSLTGESVTISPTAQVGELVWESDPDTGVGGYWEYDPNTNVTQVWAGGRAGLRMAALPRGAVGRSIAVKVSAPGSSPLRIVGIVIRARYRGRRNTRRQ